jgi:hypothetical protein
MIEQRCRADCFFGLSVAMELIFDRSLSRSPRNPYWGSLSFIGEHNDPTKSASRLKNNVCNFLVFLLLNCSKIVSENLKEFQIIYLGLLIDNRSPLRLNRRL